MKYLLVPISIWSLYGWYFFDKTLGHLIFALSVVLWSYISIHMFGYDSIDGAGEPKIIIEDEND